MQTKKIAFFTRGFCAVQTLVFFSLIVLAFLAWNTIKTNAAYKTISVEGVKMRFVECVTGDDELPADGPLPLIIAFHGFGDRAHNFKARFRNMEYPARIIIPEAYDSKNTSWYDYRIRDKTIPVSALRAGAFVRAIKKKYGVSERPVVYGFSQGGVLALYMSLWDPALFSHAVIESAYLPRELHPPVRRLDVEYPPISHYHGSQDRIVFSDDVKRCTSNITRLGIPITLHVYERDHQVFDPAFLSDLYRELANACDLAFSAEKQEAKA